MQMMPIDAAPGTKVIFSNPSAGFQYDQDACREALMKVGDEFTVTKTVIHDWRTELYLDEHPGIAFNTVNFGISK